MPKDPLPTAGCASVATISLVGASTATQATSPPAAPAQASIPATRPGCWSWGHPAKGERPPWEQSGGRVAVPSWLTRLLPVPQHSHLWRKLQTAGSAVGQLRGQGRHSMAPRTVVKGLERCCWGSRAGWGALGLLRADGGGQIVLTASDAHVGRWVALASGGSRVGRAGGTHGWAVR